MSKTFKVFDNNTNKEADPSDIVLHEEWAKNLIYCDMEGFALLEDGTLILLDECGNFVYCSPERFEVRWGEAEKRSAPSRALLAIANYLLAGYRTIIFLPLTMLIPFFKPF